MTKRISILGCGWLGFPLAKTLLQKGFQIKGSTTSDSKLEELEAEGILAFNIELSETEVKGDIEKFLKGSEILILNIPPGLRKNSNADFVLKIENLLTYIEASSIEKLLFVSSTSVYADEFPLATITENTNAQPDSEAGRQLLQVEKLLEDNPSFETTILRFAGLFGEERHPAKSLSGKTGIKNPDAPVNLIHQLDAIAIISAIIEKNIWNETCNASTTPHPSRKDYYTAICKAMDLPIPKFENTSLSKGKRIDSSKLVRLLDYDFQVKLQV